jgi:hypothetical protein
MLIVFSCYRAKNTSVTAGALQMNSPVTLLALLLLRTSPFASQSTPRVIVIHIVAQDLREAFADTFTVAN